MAELTPKERLQPSLFDRLADDAPSEVTESYENRVLSLDKIQECVIRDLGWLLNTENLTAVHNLDDLPDAATSTVNYGIPTLSGKVMSSVDRRRLEESLRNAIATFESRLLPDSIRVRARFDDGGSRPHALRFEIEATLWAQPTPLKLLVNAEVDLETGSIEVKPHQ